MLKIFTLLIVTMLLTSDARALTPVDRAGVIVPHIQKWADRSSLQLPTGSVLIRKGCKGNAGTYWPGVICLDDRYPETFLHEAMHMADDLGSDTPEWVRARAEFMRIHRIQTNRRGELLTWGDHFWVPAWDVYARAEEWFAEAGAYCALFPENTWEREARWVDGKYGYEPKPRQWLATCYMLKELMG